MQLLRQLNRLLDKHPESRRRHLSFHTPAIVPVWTQARRLQAILQTEQSSSCPQATQRIGRLINSSCQRSIFCWIHLLSQHLAPEQ